MSDHRPLTITQVEVVYTPTGQSARKCDECGESAIYEVRAGGERSRNWCLDHSTHTIMTHPHGGWPGSP